MSKFNENGVWSETFNKAGRYTLNTENTFVAKNIVITIPKANTTGLNTHLGKGDSVQIPAGMLDAPITIDTANITSGAVTSTGNSYNFTNFNVDTNNNNYELKISKDDLVTLEEGYIDDNTVVGGNDILVTIPASNTQNIQTTLGYGQSVTIPSGYLIDKVEISTAIDDGTISNKAQSFTDADLVANGDNMELSITPELTIGAGYVTPSTTVGGSAITVTIPKAQEDTSVEGKVTVGPGYLASAATYDTQGAPGEIKAVSTKPTDATEIADTTVVVPTGGGLKISKGYYSSDSYISLATLVPDSYDNYAMAQADYIRANNFAWDKDGAPIVGTIVDYDGSFTFEA